MDFQNMLELGMKKTDSTQFTALCKYSRIHEMLFFIWAECAMFIHTYLFLRGSNINQRQYF